MMIVPSGGSGGGLTAAASVLASTALLYLGLLRSTPVVLGQVQQNALSRVVQFHVSPTSTASRVGVYWIHSETREPINLGEPLAKGQTTNFNSFVGHEFELRELPDVGTGECGGTGEDVGDVRGVCRSGYFKVKEYQDQVVKIQDGFEVVHDAIFHDVEQPADRAEPFSVERGAVDEQPPVPIPVCQERAKMAIQASGASLAPDMATRTLSDLISCVETNVTRALQDKNDEINYQAASRTAIAALLENYTCADDEMPTSTPIRLETWEHGGVTRDVKIMHERDNSRIHILSDFISEEECRAMEEAAAPKLHKATVADGKGGSELSKNRKAMQAGITVPWDKESEGHPIAVLSRRVYDYANHILGFSIDEFGQEDLMSIQYFGRGDDDAEPDRYTPHCDGDCTGMKHRDGTRVATMVLYCTIPKRGGATNFRNAGLHVVPEKGTGTFFSYIGPDRTMDKGFTEHSGCPVVEGEKKIVTQWIRLGVDTEHPWDSRNTLGIPYSDINDD